MSECIGGLVYFDDSCKAVHVIKVREFGHNKSKGIFYAVDVKGCRYIVSEESKSFVTSRFYLILSDLLINGYSLIPEVHMRLEVDWMPADDEPPVALSSEVLGKMCLHANDNEDWIICVREIHYMPDTKAIYIRDVNNNSWRARPVSERYFKHIVTDLLAKGYHDMSDHYVHPDEGGGNES